MRKKVAATICVLGSCLAGCSDTPVVVEEGVELCPFHHTPAQIMYLVGGDLVSDPPEFGGGNQAIQNIERRGVIACPESGYIWRPLSGSWHKSVEDVSDLELPVEEWLAELGVLLDSEHRVVKYGQEVTSDGELICNNVLISIPASDAHRIGFHLVGCIQEKYSFGEMRHREVKTERVASGIDIVFDDGQRLRRIQAWCVANSDTIELRASDYSDKAAGDSDLFL